MKAFVTCSFFLLIVFAGNGQDKSNKITVTESNCSFNISTIANLLAGQSTANAFSFQVLSKANSYHVYVKGANSTGTTTPIPPNKLGVQVTSRTGAAATYNSSKILLSTVDQALVTNGSSTSTGATFSCTLFLEPLDFSYVPGVYNFVVTFTMTQP
ncbi:MAG: hypothetical protein JWN76_827 [Chitinophagaceae bacterium]|nr:hypothetical protein [Chitinophagaceae bacterium]